MKTQEDSVTRILALDNLREMCEAASGTSHRYWIETVSRSRVHIGYSNPDEWGAENPMFAVFPSFPSPWPADNRDNPRVLVEECMRVINDTWNGEGWQAFDPVWAYYALRGKDGWRTLRCETGAASRAHMVAQHIAYHNAVDSGERCATCKETETVT